VVIRVGDVVEDFELPDQSGKPRRLTELAQQGPVVLFFYPAAMTPGCTRESCHFRDLAAEFGELGASRVGISRDPVEKQAQFSEKYGFDYPLLSDPDRKVAKRFGVTEGFKLGPVKRTTFVIDRDLRVVEIIKSELNMNAHADKALSTLRRIGA